MQKAIRKFAAGIVVSLSMIGFAGAQQAPVHFSETLTVLSSSQARGRVSKEHVTAMLFSIASQLGIAEQPMPNIVVFHISSKEALAQTVPAEGALESATLIFPNGQRQHSYHLWVVDQPADQRLLIMLAEVLKRSFALEIPQDRLTSLIVHSSKRARAVVDVNELQHK